MMVGYQAMEPQYSRVLKQPKGKALPLSPIYKSLDSLVSLDKDS